ncbi:family 43 glycosylhydrolase [Glacieibacterium megasporae]|uniref:family 43 glycosylhydrolase n=1 Tax=Glacieibacterium megasporae TaxID=2835787 RepID=UPI001C1E7A2C|nr:family 43 glycosylhydrolase [Polymorphobacter megasporae]UAJ11092.1 family 43 glycosylhydrolase [Polymorphobacter megasporae]
MSTSRREVLMLALAGGAALPAMARQAGAGIEGQRTPDLGNGDYLNPVLAGDHPDPSVLKDGDDYWMTHSSFDASPGLLIWHSRDLVNWTPVGPALRRPLGTVFAVDLVKHDGRYFIYIPFMKAAWSAPLASFANIFVIHAPSMHGPWSDPIDLKIGDLIDPGHAVGTDGQRYLFLSGVNRVRLAPDGLSTVGAVEKVYDGWHYPDDWVTEAYALEGPKLFRRGDWHYLVSAVGGTGGPPTGHMVIAARARTLNGPWENCPHNPIVRTWSEAERWWSRGHATCVEGPDGRWFLIYHGYENGYRSLGRQTLLEPIAWSADGWFHATGGDLSNPLPRPRGVAGPHGLAGSDDFSKPAFGTRWSFYGAGPDEVGRARVDRGTLTLAGKGTGPNDCSPLTQVVGDHAYEVIVDCEIEGTAQGGLLLFYNDRLFLGMGIDGTRMTSYRGGKSSYWQEPAPAVRRLHLRIVNERQIVTFYYSRDGKSWTRHGVRSEVSGYNANTMDDLAQLRPALFAAGGGSAHFRDFRYRALD